MLKSTWIEIEMPDMSASLREMVPFGMDMHLLISPGISVILDFPDV
jgi:hypothetical protein